MSFLKMYMDKDWFDLKKFLMIGCILFAIAFVCNVVMMYQEWAFISWWGRIGGLATRVIFLGVLSYFFYWNYGQQPKDDNQMKKMKNMHKDLESFADRLKDKLEEDIENGEEKTRPDYV